MSVALSAKQRSIVDAEGAIYVKASAGSGKTRVLTERVRHLLTKTKKKILVLTFTNKAGEEIKERLSDVSDIDKRTFIGTFHSFCQSILENHGNLMGYATMPHIFEEENDRLELVKQAIEQIPIYQEAYKGQKDFRYNALKFISKVKRKLINENEIENQTDDKNIVLFYRNYQDILRSQNAIDFDDLLLKAYALFIDFPNVAALYRRSFFAICIDEAQDLNNAQYQLLKVLTNQQFNNIMMVGDPNQSIFHFNGSSSDYMDKEFVRDFSPKMIHLNENYRSSIAVLQAAKQIIPDVTTIEGTVKKGIFELHRANNEKAEAKWVTDKITKIMSLKKHDDIEGTIQYEKIAVLARSKYLFKPLEKHLKKSNIPYFYKMSFGALKLESEIMQIFDLAFRVKLNSQDTIHLSRLLNKLFPSGYSNEINNDKNLSKLINFVNNENHKSIIKQVIALNPDGSNFKKTLQTYKENISVEDDNEKNMLFNDIDELIQHWHHYAKKTKHKSLQHFKNAMALGQTHLITQPSGITLSTVHTMKGQEFDIVFIIGMDEGSFPDYRAIQHGGLELKQEKNNLYVAFTRAKRWLYVTWPEKRTMPWGDIKPRQISRFLKNIKCTETLI